MVRLATAGALIGNQADTEYYELVLMLAALVKLASRIKLTQEGD
jgi:sulfate adenylyltransferase